ncbi:peptidylprolyl isomerase [Suttonella sp. R2A3]|uniref:peptidylprolyl isomerase n=1 Tax=Suttonella sp. R2A3 TaxID=2908648 RepID=UPI001F221186|nr:peptidylprolyl isomerase [Suttonella sp. R2A3]UJF25390.1 peptidylprolyl isomerase [Suttonella sp. R2A3]
MRHLLISLVCVLSAATGWALDFGPAGETNLKGLDEIAVVINEETITRRQLAKELAVERRMLPKGINLPEGEINEQLTERVIMNHLLKQMEQRGDFSASTEEIDRAVAMVAQQNGLDKAQLLRRVRRDTGLDEAAFRAQMASNIVQDKLKQALIGRNINISPATIETQIAQITRLNETTLYLQDLLLPIPEGSADERGPAVKETIRQVSEALNEHNDDLAQVAQVVPKAKFVDLGAVNIAQVPPRFAEAVSRLSSGEVLSTPVVDQDGMHFLKVRAKQSQSGQAVVDQANVAHILLRAQGKEDFIAQQRIAEQLVSQLQQGADFAEVARRYSQDPTSAVRGGELGWVGADEMVPEFAQAMLQVPLGEITAPVQTPYGWHILKVNDRRQVDRSDDVLRARIRESLYNKYLEDAWQQRLIQLRQQAYVEIR